MANRKRGRTGPLLAAFAAVLAALPLAAQRPCGGVPCAASSAAAPAKSTVSHNSGELFGLVTDAAGRPESRAVVEVRAAGLHGSAEQVLTGAAGVFQLAGLEPGTYYVQVGKGARVALRRKVEIHASERALLLVNLPRLVQSVQFGPPNPKGDPAFDWALRQATIWRPVLRLDDGAQDPADTSLASSPIAGYVALTAGAGSSAFASPDLATAFRVDSSLWGSFLSVTGDVGTNGQGGGSDTRVQASIRPRDASNQQVVTMAVRQISIPGMPALPALRVASFNYANGLDLGDSLHVQVGSLVNAVSMTDTVATFNPYLRATYRLGGHSQLEYRAASAVPPLVFNRDSADMPDPTPQVTLDHNRARIEQARHQELRYSDTLTPNDTIEAAVFAEHFSRAAVNGAEADSSEIGSSSLLPDLLNNMFIGDGGNYGGWGYRVVYDHGFGGTWHADLAYAAGAALAPAAPGFTASLATALAPVRAGAYTVKLSGVTPLTHTQVICSYRGLSRPTATGVDLYDDSLAQSDSYANVYVRQPLPGLIGGGDKIEALIEIHNLLAQGYLPMVGSDGHTLYLVQSARSLRGGFTIRF
ncbi:MAG TPA: carboxypeptidase-like regulatory domain-containing protein [Terriglobales bacterium]|nr:carboxypeptidase-like regulatory domain-containing protein [Terriglobales bacterium]